METERGATTNAKFLGGGREIYSWFLEVYTELQCRTSTITCANPLFVRQGGFHVSSEITGLTSVIGGGKGREKHTNIEETTGINNRDSVAERKKNNLIMFHTDKLGSNVENNVRHLSYGFIF